MLLHAEAVQTAEILPFMPRPDGGRPMPQDTPPAPANEPSFQDDIDAALKQGVLVVCFQRACDALRDPRLKQSEREVLAELLEAMNQKTALAWPSVQTIAARLWMTVKTARNALYRLRELGYLAWERRRVVSDGSRKTAAYYTVPAVSVDREALQAKIAEYVKQLRGPFSKKCPAGGAYPMGEACPADRDKKCPAGGDKEPTNKEPTKSPLVDLEDDAPASKPKRAKPEGLTQHQIDAAFDQWYEAYPRKKQPVDARKAYTKAVKAGATPEQLLAAVKAYEFREDKQYIPYPATWLNKGAWLEVMPRTAAPAAPMTVEQLAASTEGRDLLARLGTEAGMRRLREIAARAAERSGR